MPIHGLLEGIIFPAKHVVGMAAIASGVSCRPDEGLLAVGEVCWVIEGPGVPDRLEKYLREPDWMRRRTRATRLESTTFGVRDVVLVVRRI